MKYRYLGGSGLLVSRICLGTMTFGQREWGCDGKTAAEITGRFLDKGGNFIDTADMYSDGAAEEMLGKALREHQRDDLVIATKCFFRTRQTPNAKGLSRKHIVEACEASLKRLGIDYIDLYQIHGPDPNTPVGETMSALDALVKTGKVRYLGCSNLYAWQFVKANCIAGMKNLERFISGQYMYSLLKREVELEILPACEDQGMGFLCWSPLGSGLLSGKYRGSAQPGEDTRIAKRAKLDIPRYWKEESLKLVDEVVRTAEGLGMTPAQVALSWLLHDRRVTAVVIGARKVEQLEENMECGEWDLPNAERDCLGTFAVRDHSYPREWMDVALPNTFGEEEFPPRNR